MVEDENELVFRGTALVVASVTVVLVQRWLASLWLSGRLAVGSLFGPLSDRLFAGI